MKTVEVVQSESLNIAYQLEMFHMITSFLGSDRVVMCVVLASLPDAQNMSLPARRLLPIYEQWHFEAFQNYYISAFCE